MYYDQADFDVRFEWGLEGARNVGRGADVVVIVDALSFSTCVDVAVEREAVVFPCRWKDDGAREFAEQHDAVLAGPRDQDGVFSLSPASMQRAKRGDRIVLPSPNGSALTKEAESLRNVVLCGCFRNCRAIARFARAQGRSIAVIAAGERWSDDSPRSAVEDMAAAGAIIARLKMRISPEAEAAVAVWNQASHDLTTYLSQCSSGRELIERGFADDVRLASETNVSYAVPVLRDGGYVDAGGRLFTPRQDDRK